MGEAEVDAIGLLGEEDAVGLAVVLLLVDDSRPDPLRVVFAPEGVDVADGEPAARLLGVLAIDRQADLHVIPLEPGRRPVLRDEREAQALRVVADRRPDLLDRQRVDVRLADGTRGAEEHAAGHAPSPHAGARSPLNNRAQGKRPAFWSVAREAVFATLQRAAGI